MLLCLVPAAGLAEGRGWSGGDLDGGGAAGERAGNGEELHLEGWVDPPASFLRGAAPGRSTGFGAAVALQGDLVVCGAPAGARPEAGGRVFGALPAGAPGRGTPGPGTPGRWAAGEDSLTWAGPAPGGGSAPGTGSAPRVGEDEFGRLVLHAHGWLVLGAPGSLEGSDRMGSVTIVHLDPWTGWPGEPRLLRPPTAEAGTSFGASAALRFVGDGAWLAVGAPHAAHPDTGRPLAGVVHLFWLEGPPPGRWIHQRVLRPRSGTVGGAFGAALCFAGDTLVVGSPGHGAVAPGAGAAFGFGLDGGERWRWTGNVPGARVGTALALGPEGAGGGARRAPEEASSRSRLAVGAPGVGRVDLLELTPGGWTFRLSGSLQGAAAEGFGLSLAASAGHLFVGAPRAAVDGLPSAGVLYHFGPGGHGGPSQTLVSPAPRAHGEFGAALAADRSGRSTRVAVGEPGTGAAARPRPFGRVHLFALR